MPQHVTTQAQAQLVASAISRNQSPDIHADYELNPYRGAEHGGVARHARPTPSDLHLSPRVDFEPRIFAKPTLAQVLSAELRAPS